MHPACPPADTVSIIFVSKIVSVWVVEIPVRVTLKLLSGELPLFSPPTMPEHLPLSTARFDLRQFTPWHDNFVGLFGFIRQIKAVSEKLTQLYQSSTKPK